MFSIVQRKDRLVGGTAPGGFPAGGIGETGTDLIVTESVSRFARNTVDSLTTVRKLKEKGVEAYSQKENIYTLDSKGELLITIMSSLAQEESRSISENCTWRKRKRFADGKASLAYSSFLGYRKGEDGQMEVVPEEAETVRLIYRIFRQGQMPYAIAKYLTDRNIPTPTGKETWQHGTVENILRTGVFTFRNGVEISTEI